MPLNRAAVRGRYTLIPDRETVSVRLKRPDGDTTLSIADCWQKPTRVNGRFVGILLTGSEQMWHIPDARLNPASNGRRMTKGDEITTADLPGIVFEVIAVEFKTLRTVWVCLCGQRRA